MIQDRKGSTLKIWLNVQVWFQTHLESYIKLDGHTYQAKFIMELAARSIALICWFTDFTISHCCCFNKFDMFLQNSQVVIVLFVLGNRFLLFFLRKYNDFHVCLCSPSLWREFWDSGFTGFTGLYCCFLILLMLIYRYHWSLLLFVDTFYSYLKNNLSLLLFDIVVLSEVFI